MDPVETQRRLAMAAACDQLWNGEITRSDFLRVCARAHDIFYLDQAWVGRFVNDTVPVRELMATQELADPHDDVDGILPALVEHLGSYDGRVVGIPYDIPIPIILDHQDIFERLHLSPPKTVPNYLATVRAIHRERHPHVSGTTAIWKPGHYALLIDAATWLWAHGGSCFGPHERPAIRDDRAVAGRECMLALGTYVPPEASTWDWSGAAKRVVEGRAGIYLNAGEWFSMGDDPAQSRMVGLVDAAPCPAELAIRPARQGSVDETPGLSRQGGGYLGLSKSSKPPDAAWILMPWATSADVTTRRSRTAISPCMSSIPRCVTSTYRIDPRVAGFSSWTSGGRIQWS